MANTRYTKEELKEWWIGKARTAAGYRRNILGSEQRSRDDTVIGKLYFFSYDPKFKAILPIYDKFPLVFPIERYPNGFLGLNIHYLSHPERLFLLDKLAHYASNKNLTRTTRLQLSYDILQSSGKTVRGLVKPCVHRYLFGHVRSKFIEIAATEWDKAALIPVELFVEKK